MTGGVKRTLANSSLIDHNYENVKPAKIARKEEDIPNALMNSEMSSESENMDYMNDIPDGILSYLNLELPTNKSIFELYKWLGIHIKIHEYYKTKNSSEEEKCNMVCQISIDSDDEERKKQCGGYVKKEQKFLSSTETSNSLVKNRSLLNDFDKKISCRQNIRKRGRKQ